MKCCNLCSPYVELPFGYVFFFFPPPFFFKKQTHATTHIVGALAQVAGDYIDPNMSFGYRVDNTRIYHHQVDMYTARLNLPSFLFLVSLPTFWQPALQGFGAEKALQELRRSMKLGCRRPPRRSFSLLPAAWVCQSAVEAVPKVFLRKDTHGKAFPKSWGGGGGGGTRVEPVPC